MPTATAVKPVVPIVMTPHLIAQIDIMATRHALSRSSMIRMALMSYVEANTRP